MKTVKNVCKHAGKSVGEIEVNGYEKRMLELPE